MITRTRRTAFVIFLLTFFAYIIPLVYDLVHKPFFGWIPGIDIVSTSILPVEILERGDFFLDAYRDYFERDFVDPGFIAVVNGRTVSSSPVVAAVLALPFYGVPLGTGWLFNTGYAWLSFPQSVFFPAKFAAAFILSKRIPKDVPILLEALCGALMF